METMTEVQVEEDCTRTVNRTPIIRPTTGLLSRSLLWKMPPGKGKEKREKKDKKVVKTGKLWMR